MGWNFLSEIFLLDLVSKGSLVGKTSVCTETEKEIFVSLGDMDVIIGAEKDNILGEGGIFIRGIF